MGCILFRAPSLHLERDLRIYLKESGIIGTCVAFPSRIVTDRLSAPPKAKTFTQIHICVPSLFETTE